MIRFRTLLAGISDPAASGSCVEIAILRAANAPFQPHGPIWGRTLTVNTLTGACEGSSEWAVGDVPTRGSREVPQSQLRRSHAIINPVLGFQIRLILASSYISLTACLLVTDLAVPPTTALAIQNRLDAADITKLLLDLTSKLIESSVFSLQCSVLLQCLDSSPNGLNFL